MGHNMGVRGRSKSYCGPQLVYMSWCAKVVLWVVIGGLTDHNTSAVLDTVGSSQLTNIRADLCMHAYVLRVVTRDVTGHDTLAKLHTARLSQPIDIGVELQRHTWCHEP